MNPDLKRCSECKLPGEFHIRRQKMSRKRIRITTQSRCKSCSADEVRWHRRMKKKPLL